MATAPQTQLQRLKFQQTEKLIPKNIIFNFESDKLLIQYTLNTVESARRHGTELKLLLQYYYLCNIVNIVIISSEIQP